MQLKICVRRDNVAWVSLVGREHVTHDAVNRLCMLNVQHAFAVRRIANGNGMLYGFEIGDVPLHQMNPRLNAGFTAVFEAYSYMMVHPGCKMMAPGAAIPEELGKCIQALNTLYKSSPALYQMDDEYDGFEWVQLMKYEENVITFLRKTEKPEETLLVICNFAAIPYENYQVGVPFAGKYKEIFNSDAVEFGGEGVVNSRVKTAKAEECDEREYSIKVKLPALGVSIYSCTPGKAPARKKVTAAKTAKDKTAKDKTAGKLVRTVKAKTPAKKSVKEEKATKVEEAVKAEKKAETVKKRATVKNDNNKADRNSK